MFILFGKEQFLSYHYWSMDHALDQMFCESAERFYGANKTEKVDSATGDLSRGQLNIHVSIDKDIIL